MFVPHLGTCQSPHLAQSPQLAIDVSPTPVQSPMHALLQSTAQPYSKLKARLHLVLKVHNFSCYNIIITIITQFCFTYSPVPRGLHAFLIILCYSIFVFLMNGCFCYVSFSFLGTHQEIGWEECLQAEYFVLSWMLNFNSTQYQGVLLLQVINAFSVQSDAEMKGKVITRLCNMTELHQLLNRSLLGMLTTALLCIP